MGSKQVSQVEPNKSYDLKSVQAGPGGLVYEQFGSIHLVDTASNDDHVVPIQIHGELPNLAPHLATIQPDEIQNATISPTGARAVFEAHGEIFTVPGEKGDTRNLTNTSGVGRARSLVEPRRQDHRLLLRRLRRIPALPARSDRLQGADRHRPRPRSQLLLQPDLVARLQAHRLHRQAPAPVGASTCPSGKPVLVDKAIYGSFGLNFSQVWSPDSKWIAYHRDLDNQLHAIFLYSMETHKSTQVTDGMSDASSPAFDLNGKYLYFIASTDDGPSHAGIDLSSLDRAQTSAPYVVVLAKDGASPIPPESDDEKIKEEKKDEPKPPVTDDKKDAKADDKDKDKKADDKDKDTAKSDDKDKDKDKRQARQSHRRSRRHRQPHPLAAHSAAQLRGPRHRQGRRASISLEGPAVRPCLQLKTGSGIRAVWRFTLEKREPETVLSDIDAFTDLRRRLEDSLRPQRRLDHRAGRRPEARQRQPRQAAQPRRHADHHRSARRVEADVPRNLAHRARLPLRPQHPRPLAFPRSKRATSPISTASPRAPSSPISPTRCSAKSPSATCSSAARVRPTTVPRPACSAPTTRSKTTATASPKSYGGQNWTPGLASPLTLPGVYVKEGEYLLAVNGRELHAHDNLYEFFDGTAGKQTVLHVGPNADGKDARDVTVVPVGDEDGLRNLDWIEGNRRKVDELSGGKVAYVYMPNTGGAGYTNFNRYFYSQLDKQALVLDERWNEGGFIADYVVDVLKRFPLSGAIERDGKPIHDPVGAIFGPKVMLINQNSGSGGDAMPWYFRKAEIGKLVGTRTWGGLVGIGGYPPLLDGGYVMAPRYAIYRTQRATGKSKTTASRRT